MEQIHGFFKHCIRCIRSLIDGFQLNFTSLKKLVFIYLSFRILMDGIEEYFIQPTAWYYVNYLRGTNLFLGLILAANSAGFLAFAPFVGFLEKKFSATKAIVVISTFLKFFGNLIYSIPVNEYFPLFGRFLSGIGEGAVGVLYGVVAKCTIEENRAKAFIYFEGLFGIGAVCGPVIGSLLTFNFDILGFKINAGNSPGVILTIVWFVLLIVAIFLPSDLAESSKEITSSTDSENDDKTTLSKARDSINGSALSTVAFLYFFIFCFVFLFSLTSFYTPLLLKHRLGLGLTHVKLFYLNCSLLASTSFVASYLFVERYSETNILVFNAISSVVPICTIFYFALKWDSNMSVNAAYIWFLSLMITKMQVLNFFVISSVLSKLTPAEDASFYQSLSFIVLSLSIILARVTAGATFDKMPMMCVCLGLTVNWLFQVIWFAIEFKKI